MHESEGFLSELAARRRFGMRPGLDTIRAVMKRLGDPQDRLRFVHIAGTNGKGATAGRVDWLLRAAGIRSARYTSPHLVRINERFFIDGAPALDAQLDAAAEKVFAEIAAVEKDSGAQVTFFEALSAIAFVLFAEALAGDPDAVVVLETGLGGRLDATNIVRPENVLASVVTRIGLDHVEWLGQTHAEIASEKAGIVKPGRPVVCAEMPEAAKEVIERAASLNGCEFSYVPESTSVRATDVSLSGQTLCLTTALRNPAPVRLALGGAFQVENAATAVATADALVRGGLPIPDRAVVAGLSSVVWPGRFQHVRASGVDFVVDGAHNPDGARALRDALRGAGAKGPILMIAGYCGDKDVLAHLRVMSAVSASGFAVPIRNSRSLDPGEVAERMAMAGFGVHESHPSLASAIDRASALARNEGGTVVVCGSLFLAGEALVHLGAFPWRTDGNHPNERIH